jgi:two-component system OmpR family response regulator
MRLLVVEDEVRLARLLKRGLEEDGNAVDLQDNGASAVWMAEENAYSAIVLDVMLPDQSGFDVCRKLREKEIWVPVIMLTAKTDVEDRVRGLDAGADDYLTKPFSFSELTARLRALTRRDDRARPVEIEVGGLRLNPATHRVSRGEVEIELSPKEFSLLEQLMNNPGVVLTRTRILEANWDFAYDGGSNVIDQYISSLRKKIEQPFGRSDIETVRGVGYRLRDADGS